MVNNSTQSNKPSAQTIEHKNTTIYGVEIQILAWDKHTHVAGVIWLIGGELRSSGMVSSSCSIR